jgi:GNAT superfamily N-acetyltransferase
MMPEVFKKERGISYCGMACVLCRFEGHEDCAGCAVNDEDPEGDCWVRKCARSKGVEGCFACGDYPCGKEWPLLQDRRNKAFIRYAREYGTQALIDRLRANNENGIVYNRPGATPHGKPSGDYDALETEIEIYQLLRYGRAGRPEEDMEITIKPLSPGLTADYFDFFNCRAFTDNPPWGGCYCTNFQMSKAEEKAELNDRIEALGGGQENFMRALREVVRRQISSGALRGYLAFAGGFSIGWCNANARANFPVDSVSGFPLYAPAENKEKAVVCFEIAPEYRGRGVAAALLDRVIADARADGYSAVVAFPRVHNERDNWDFTGPVRLYEKAGFAAVTQPDGGIVMRKCLN